MTAPHASLRQFAHAKLARVVGEQRATTLIRDALIQAKLDDVATADDLLALARALATRAGFEGAVGALLSVDAVRMGAK